MTAPLQDEYGELNPKDDLQNVGLLSTTATIVTVCVPQSHLDLSCHALCIALHVCQQCLGSQHTTGTLQECHLEAHN